MSSNHIQRQRKFLQLTFQDYYIENADLVDIPAKLHNREFGMQLFSLTWRCDRKIIESDSGEQKEVGCGRSGTSYARILKCPFCDSKQLQITDWVRHLGFRTRDALLHELVQSAPHSVYHSAALYETPVARFMHEKNWRGAELIFDIDADHLDSKCTERHDSWICNDADCEESGMGPPPSDECPSCKGKSFSSRKWVCDDCLQDAKDNTLKLYDVFLSEDFGIDPEKIVLNYSGHRGYHVRVQDSKIFSLDSSARTEIVHYIEGTGFTTASFRSTVEQDDYKNPLVVISEKVPLPTSAVEKLSVPGWANRVSQAMVEFISDIDSYHGSERWVKVLKENKQEAIHGLKRTPPILSPRVKGIGDKFWQEISIRAVQSYGASIDGPVTYDLKRVIRLIGSINGKTGFKVNRLNREEIDSFNPFVDAIAFRGGTLKVHTLGGLVKIPAFKIDAEEYGPYGDEIVELPKPAALFLLCKGVANLE
ncbi:MAG: DNA primase small subunit PriS [Candidatus Thorarchaeota archaeon]|nr:MAG: DNA primase small subunit PriS [Candidatus Thorarchaeota archaeon]